MLPKRPEVQLLDIHPVEHHLAFLTVIEPFQQLHHSALALATFSHQSILFVLQELYADVVEHFVVSLGIAEDNILEFDLS